MRPFIRPPIPIPPIEITIRVLEVALLIFSAAKAIKERLE